MSRWLVLLALLTTSAFAQQGDGASAGAADVRTAAPTEQTVSGATAESEAAELTARARYNLGLQQLENHQPQAAVTTFQQARDEAGADDELRYRAAFNLGMALAAQADTQQSESPEQAIESLRSAAAWFNDAVRLAPAGDEDARVNLEITLRRIQQLADQLNQGNRLEARLTRIIDDQRGLRDRVRGLLATVEEEGAGAEPVGFQREFDELATYERTLLAEAGSIVDLAAEERALIESKEEDTRTHEERVRGFQLQALDHYLQRARQSLSDTRRRLRRLEAERAHHRADAALAELKRAREQLLDPVTVLKAVARDETSLLAHTQTLAALQSGVVRLDDDQPADAPPWLTGEHLGERQQSMAARAGEVLARLEAGTAQANAGATDPQQQRALQAAKEALPHLRAATDAMNDAHTALSTNDLNSALAAEAQAIQALARGIERFAGVRDLIELAFADQARVVSLLVPSADGVEDVALAPGQRARIINEAVNSNQDRLGRLERLLQAELAEMESQVAAGEATAASPTEAVRARYARAEELRAAAAASLRTLSDALSTLPGSEEPTDVQAPAQATLANLEELRRLFFTLVEHLQALLSDQSETHDQTATLQFEAATDRLAPELDLVSKRQAQHADTGDALGRALAQQADAAGASEDPHAQQSSGHLAEAANEVRAATGEMQNAGTVMTQAAALANTMSPQLEPALDGQLKAITHLEQAIALLQPPEQQPPDEQQQQQQQDQQQQAEQQRQQDEQMSQRQALQRLQAIRDREAARQRQRELAAAQPEPVEKDW